MGYTEIINVMFQDTNSEKVSNKLNKELDKIRQNAKNLGLDKALEKLKIPKLELKLSIDTTEAKNVLDNFIKSYKTTNIKLKATIDKTAKKGFNKDSSLDKEETMLAKELFKIQTNIAKHKEKLIKEEYALHKRINSQRITDAKKLATLNTKLANDSMVYIDKIGTKNLKLAQEEYALHKKINSQRITDAKKLATLNTKLAKDSMVYIDKIGAKNLKLAQEEYALHKRINNQKLADARKLDALNTRLAQKSINLAVTNSKTLKNLNALDNKQILDTLTNRKFNKVFFDSSTGREAKKLRKELIAIQQGVKFDKLNSEFVQMKNYILADANASDKLKRSLMNIEKRMPQLRNRFVKYNGITKTLGKNVQKLRGFFVGLTRVFIASMFVKQFLQLGEAVSSLSSSLDSLKMNPKFFAIKDQFDDIGKATGHLVSKVDMLAAVNKALYMNVDLTNGKLTKLTQMVTKVAVGMGQDVGQLMNDFVTALAKGSPIILDNVGVLLKLDEAQRLTYDSLGITDKSFKEWSRTLTQAEKRANFTTQGIKKLGEITKDMKLPTNEFKAFFNEIKDGFLKYLPIIKTTVVNVLKAVVLAFSPLLYVLKKAGSAFLWISKKYTEMKRALGLELSFSSWLTAEQVAKDLAKSLDGVVYSSNSVVNSMSKTNNQLRAFIDNANVITTLKGSANLVLNDVKKNAFRVTAKQYKDITEDFKKYEKNYLRLIASSAGKGSEAVLRIKQTKATAKYRIELAKLQATERNYWRQRKTLSATRDKELNDGTLAKKYADLYSKRYGNYSNRALSMANIPDKESFVAGMLAKDNVLFDKRIKNLTKKMKEAYYKINQFKTKQIASKNTWTKDLFGTDAVTDLDKFTQSLTKAGVTTRNLGNVFDYLVKRKLKFYKDGKTIDASYYKNLLSYSRIVERIFKKNKLSASFLDIVKAVENLTAVGSLDVTLGNPLHRIDLILKTVNKSAKKTGKAFKEVKDNWVELTTTTQRELLSPFDKKYSEDLAKYNKRITEFKKLYNSFKGRNKAFVDINFDTGVFNRIKNGSEVAVEDVIQKFSSIKKVVESQLNETGSQVTRYQKISLKSFLVNIGAVESLINNFLIKTAKEVDKYRIKLKFQADTAYIDLFINDVTDKIKSIKIPKIKPLNLGLFKDEYNNLTEQIKNTNKKLLLLEKDKNNKLKLMAEKRKLEVKQQAIIVRDARLKELESNLPKGESGGVDYKALNKEKRSIITSSKEKLKSDLILIDNELKRAIIKNSNETLKKTTDNYIKRADLYAEHINTITAMHKQNIINRKSDNEDYWEETQTFFKRVGNSFKTIKINPIDIDSFIQPEQALTRIKNQIASFSIPPEFKKFVDYTRKAGDYGKFSIKIKGAKNLGTGKLKELSTIISQLNTDFEQLAKKAVAPAKLMSDAFHNALREMGTALGEFGASMTFKLADNNNMLALKRKEDLARIAQDAKEGNLTEEDALAKKRDIERKFLLDKENYEKQARKQLLMGLAQTFWAKGVGYTIESIASFGEGNAAKGSAELATGAGLMTLAGTLGYLGAQIQMSTFNSSKSTSTGGTKDNYYDVHYALYTDNRDFNRKLVKYNGGR